MVVTWAYRKHPANGLQQQLACDTSDLPRLKAEGWVDSPSKIPGMAPPEKVSAMDMSKLGREPPPTGASHGERQKLKLKAG